MSARTLLDRLEQGLEQLGEDPELHPCTQYLLFLDKLRRWNKAYNLTAINDDEGMVTRHLLDCLAVLPYIHGTRCLDIGTGAGLPGLILALARPDTHWTLLDSRIKKVRFLHHVMLQFKLSNIEIVHSRAEDYHPRRAYSTIICRALSSLADFYALARPLLDESGRMLAMKGTYPAAELDEGVPGSVEVRPLNVPGLEAERHLVIMQ